MKEICKNCRAWERDGSPFEVEAEVDGKMKKKELHRCKRHAPQVFYYMVHNDMATSWPLTSGDDSCCEFLK